MSVLSGTRAERGMSVATAIRSCYKTPLHPQFHTIPFQSFPGSNGRTTVTLTGERPRLPEPGGSARCHWNDYGGSATTRLKDSPHAARRPRQERVHVVSRRSTLRRARASIAPLPRPTATLRKEVARGSPGREAPCLPRERGAPTRLGPDRQRRLEEGRSAHR